MLEVKGLETKSTIINVNFEFLALNRMLKMKINSKIMTLKSLRPLLAERFNSDFAHIRLKFTAKNDKKEILDPEMPIYQLPYFQTSIEQYKIEV